MYPLGSIAFVGDQTKLAFIVKRPVGVTSPEAGSLEALLHRRIINYSDPRGDDDTILTDSLFVVQDTMQAISNFQHQLRNIAQYPARPFFSLSLSIE